MEYKRSCFERNVRNKCNKLRQALQNVRVKGTTSTIGRNRNKSPDKCSDNTNSNKCQDLKVRETYDEVLDLRDKAPTSKDEEKKSNDTSDTEQQFLDKVCEFPNMHYKIMTLCSVKNSSKFSEQFNTKTNIISERIVNKQLELQAMEKPPYKTKPTCKVPSKIGEKIVIQKIIEKENELQQKKVGKKVPKVVNSKSETKISQKKIRSILNSKSEVDNPSDSSNTQMYKPRFQLSTKPEITRNSKMTSSLEIFKSRFQRSTMGISRTKTSKTEMPSSRADSLENSSLETRKLNASKAEMRISRDSSWERSRPRFLLSTKSTRRCAVSHSSIQVNIKKSSACVNTQTENMIQLRNTPVQTYQKSVTNEKKMQTRLCKTDTVETSPVFIEGPAKYTSTTCDQYHSEQPTQMYEHLTVSDLVCLDWVNRHLFGVNVNPHNIVVDDKIKEVSELASKSTFFSETESFLPR